MPVETSLLPCTSRYYQITVEGMIAQNWSEWLNGMQVVSHKEPGGMQVTTLSGAMLDQVALRGLLNRLWDLNLVLRSVHQFDSAVFPDQK
jgi:hypothetical protein